MENKTSPTTIVFALLTVVVLIVYLMFFNFNVNKAYDFTVEQVTGVFK